MCIELAFKNLRCNMSWCHLGRYFYSFRFRLIWFGWLHQVIDCLRRLCKKLTKSFLKQTILTILTKVTKSLLKQTILTLIISTACWLPSCLALILSSCPSIVISSRTISRSSPSSVLLLYFVVQDSVVLLIWPCYFSQAGREKNPCDRPVSPKPGPFP